MPIPQDVQGHEDSGEAHPLKKRKKQNMYSAENATIPELLLPTFSEKLTREDWLRKGSYTMPVTKGGVRYRFSVNWVKQSLWIYDGNIDHRNWAFNTFGGVDKAFAAAFQSLPDAQNILAAVAMDIN